MRRAKPHHPHLLPDDGKKEQLARLARLQIVIEGPSCEARALPAADLVGKAEMDALHSHHRWRGIGATSGSTNSLRAAGENSTSAE